MPRWPGYDDKEKPKRARSRKRRRQPRRTLSRVYCRQTTRGQGVHREVESEVWVYRKNQWVALFSTDLPLSVEQIVTWYGARWKIESGYKELKQDIGSADSQTGNPHAVTNHLHFCMMATTLTWILADQLESKPKRRHAVASRRHFAFSDVRRCFTELAMRENFNGVFPSLAKHSNIPL
jgi:IS4 transposase